MQPTENIDLAGRENAALLTSAVLGWWRKDVPLEVSYRYWRDVHGVLITRVPGVYQYRLLHLAPNRSDLWAIDGIDYALPDPDQPHGIAQILFLSEEDNQTYSASPLQSKYIYKDEQNLCDRNVTVSSIGSNACTYIDRTGEVIKSGEPEYPSFVVCIQQSQGTNTEEFRHYLGELVRPWSEQNEVIRLRLHLLEPFDESANSPCVSHDWPKEKHYQAWMELVLRDQAFFKQLSSSTGEHVQFIKAIHTFAIVARYTLVYNGKPTDVGLRGFPAVQTIEQAGADNQKAIDLLEALYGEVVQGHTSPKD